MYFGSLTELLRFNLILDCGTITFFLILSEECYYTTPMKKWDHERYKTAINNQKAIPGSYKPRIAIFVATNPD